MGTSLVPTITITHPPTLRPDGSKQTLTIELRWIDGVYSTTYRNLLAVERDFLVRGFRLTPYGLAEVFYDSPKHSWNEEWYTGGIEWPYKSLFMIDT